MHSDGGRNKSFFFVLKRFTCSEEVWKDFKEISQESEIKLGEIPKDWSEVMEEYRRVEHK